MSHLVDVLNLGADAWAGLVAAVLVQSTLLFLLMVAAAALMRESSPVVRHWLWQIVAIKLLVMPLWTVSVVLPTLTAPERPEAATRVGKTGGVTNATGPLRLREMIVPAGAPGAAEPAPEPRFAWLGEVGWKAWLMLAWLAVVAWEIALLATGWLALGRELKRATPAEHEGLLATVAALAWRMGLKVVPRVVLVDRECSPYVCGLPKPTLVLPRTLLETLGEDDLRMALAHELAHIKRRDLLWLWLPTIARRVYWFHPVAYLVVWAIHLERELACDQATMLVNDVGPAGYARMLVNVVSHLSRPTILRAAAAAGLDGQGPSLESPTPEPRP
ncbi:MAG TPA: M56 family metallopeptidase [Isosphaeraceae bacterium]|jgi:beta-lactamase regulating signal transducer with metallopeptidase domain|nr:M56 family metallopeptidase [Isosphaeraceae bacterium]